MIEANEMHYFSNLFGKELYMFRRDLLSIIRSLDIVFTAIVIFRFSVNKVLRLLMMENKSVRNM